MAKETPTDYRLRRFAELLACDEFAGNKAALGRALGWKNGALVWQILSQQRPITEKLIERVESIRGGKYAGWFSGATPSTTRESHDVKQEHAWPLGSLITPERWASLSDSTREAVIAAAEAAMVESLIGSPPSSGKLRSNGA